jgi:hypothetical protein
MQFKVSVSPNDIGRRGERGRTTVSKKGSAKIGQSEKNGSAKIRHTGAYFVKAAETRWSRVESRPARAALAPSTSDKKLVDALIRNKRG